MIDAVVESLNDVFLKAVATRMRLHHRFALRVGEFGIGFYAFRIMAGIGFALFVLMLWSGWAALSGRLQPAVISSQKMLLWAWVAAIPLGYIAVDMGWTVREVGRQPWIIYGLLRTSDGVSYLPVESVAFTTAGFFLMDSLMLTLFVLFAYRIVRSGPDFSLPVPKREAGELSPEGHRTAVSQTYRGHAGSVSSTPAEACRQNSCRRLPLSASGWRRMRNGPSRA